MDAPDWRQAIRSHLDRLRQDHLYRSRPVVRPKDSTDSVRVEIDGREYVNFASNDYLGLTHHPRVIAAAAEAVGRYGAGTGAAPLVSGYTPAHALAETALAEWKGTESSVLLPSGYQANAAAVQTLAIVGGQVGGVRFLLDKLCHASLVDAVRASGAPFRVFPHNGLAKLARLLESGEQGEVDDRGGTPPLSPLPPLQVVVTESIFSMDGDAADLAGIIALKARHPFLLLLDEAHGGGVYGPAGSGYAAECGLQDHVDVTIVTLSKALGGAGGAVCAGREFCEAVVNFGRPYLFSTSPPASVAVTAVASIGVLRDEPQRQRRLRELARFVRSEFRAGGFEPPPGDSPIIPVILGTEQAALDAAARLRDEGLFVVAIRPPTVARGSSRLRITLSSEHTDGQVQRLVRAVRSLRAKSGRNPVSL